MKIRILIPALVATSLLIGCGGGGGGGTTDTTETTTDDREELTSENTLAITQEATLAVNDTAKSGSETEEINSALDSLFGAGATVSSMAGTNSYTSTVACEGGGSLTMTSLQNDDNSSTLDYTASNCSDSSDTLHNGQIIITIRNLEDANYAHTLEMTMETGSGGFTVGNCSLNGGILYRYAWNTTVVNDTTTTHTWRYEYGTTASGFTRQCPDDNLVLAANTTVTNTFSYTVQNGVWIDSSNTVSAGGSFTPSSAEGSVDFETEEVEYPEEGGDSVLGTEQATCPSNGVIIIKGRNNRHSMVRFGSHAAPDAVKVVDPDGNAQGFASCSAYLAAN